MTTQHKSKLPDLSKYEKYIELTAGKIRYYELGSGTNYTILIHGNGIVTSADTFQFVIEDMAKHLKIFAIDLPGYGKSIRKMPYGPTFDIDTDAIREFIDVMGLGKANIVGHSAGGWFGGLLAYESPDRVRKLVMVGSAGLNVEPLGGSRVGIENQPARKPTKEGAMQGISRSFVEGSSLTPELGEALAEHEISFAQTQEALESQIPLQNQMGIPEQRRFYLLQRRMPHIKVPTMIMWGKGGGKPLSDKYPRAGQPDVMDPYPTWTAEWEKIGGDIRKSSKPWAPPGAKLVPMPTGHNVHWEQPKEFVRVVTEFLTAP